MLYFTNQREPNKSSSVLGFTYKNISDFSAKCALWPYHITLAIN